MSRQHTACRGHLYLWPWFATGCGSCYQPSNTSVATSTLFLRGGCPAPRPPDGWLSHPRNGWL